MRTSKYFGLCLSVAFLSAGAYELHDSIRNPGRFAEEGILIGAIFSALALVAMAWSIKVYLLTKAVERHMRGH
jgi:hypothetical protein